MEGVRKKINKLFRKPESINAAFLENETDNLSTGTQIDSSSTQNQSGISIPRYSNKVNMVPKIRKLTGNAFEYLSHAEFQHFGKETTGPVRKNTGYLALSSENAADSKDIQPSNFALPFRNEGNTIENASMSNNRTDIPGPSTATSSGAAGVTQQPETQRLSVTWDQVMVPGVEVDKLYVTKNGRKILLKSVNETEIQAKSKGQMMTLDVRSKSGQQLVSKQNDGQSSSLTLPYLLEDGVYIIPVLVSDKTAVQGPETATSSVAAGMRRKSEAQERAFTSGQGSVFKAEVETKPHVTNKERKNPFKFFAKAETQVETRSQNRDHERKIQTKGKSGCKPDDARLLNDIPPSLPEDNLLKHSATNYDRSTIYYPMCFDNLAFEDF